MAGSKPNRQLLKQPDRFSEEEQARENSKNIIKSTRKTNRRTHQQLSKFTTEFTKQGEITEQLKNFQLCTQQ
jgi:small-conductance mechanosensitive channel